MKNIKKLGALYLALVLAGCASQQPASINSTNKGAVQGQALSGMLASTTDSQQKTELFIQHMVSRYGFSAADLTSLLSGVNKPAPRIKSRWHPGPRNWAEYRALFIKPAIIDAGVNFMVQNQAAFARAEATYHVPQEIIAAIIGVETHYGQNLGNYRVLDSLAWQAFMPNRRNHFYQSELENYLLLCRENSWDARSAYGSTAGALGLGQFEPSSYRRIAVDFDGDGKRDLFTSPADAIGSIAHYFRLSHWRYGEPVATPASLTSHTGEDLVQDRPYPSYSLQKLANYGVYPAVRLPAYTQAGLFELDGDPGGEYWLIHTNFNVIKTYNKDNWYAMAVYELSQALKAGLTGREATPPAAGYTTASYAGTAGRPTHAAYAGVTASPRANVTPAVAYTPAQPGAASPAAGYPGASRVPTVEINGTPAN
jgi:membrane-bound lytic murein transglycosylase B